MTGKNSDFIFLIDFGLAQNYWKKDGSHIDYEENVGMFGTSRYTSINSHLKI